MESIVSKILSVINKIGNFFTDHITIQVLTFVYLVMMIGSYILDDELMVLASETNCWIGLVGLAIIRTIKQTNQKQDDAE